MRDAGYGMRDDILELGIWNWVLGFIWHLDFVNWDLINIGARDEF
jgi:hypothetical protein